MTNCAAKRQVNMQKQAMCSVSAMARAAASVVAKGQPTMLAANSTQNNAVSAYQPWLDC